MHDKYAILKRLAHQKAKDEVSRIITLSSEEIQKSIIDARLKCFEQEILIEELRHDKKKVEGLAKKYSEIVKKIQIGCVLCDKNGSILDANPLGVRMFGIPPLEKSVGRPFALSIRVEERTRFLDWIAKVFSGYTENETIFRTMGDAYVSIKGTQLFDEELLISAMDITKQQNELKILRLVKQAFEGTTESIIITDANANIIYANNAFTKTTGFSKQEVIGKNPSIMKSGIYSREFYQKLWSELLEKGSWSGQIADKNRDGKLSIHQTNITAIKEDDKITNFVAIFTDITKQQEMSEKILELSIYDALTRLPNRQMFKNRLEELCISNFGEREGFALLFIDLDNFKNVNDTYGHSFGDELLIEVARRLKYTVRKSDLVARIGGDEFVVILEATNNPSTIQHIAENIITSLSEDIHLSIGHIANIGCSIGIAVYPNDARNIEELIKYADIAMYRAKEEGRNRYFFYNQDMSSISIRLSKLKNMLSDAEKSGEIYLKFQPLYDAKTLKAIGVEALARWRNVHFGEVLPLEFINLAERSGYIKSLGRWIYKSACEEISRSEFFGDKIKELAINISSVQLKEPTFVNDITQTTAESGLKPHNVVLEVTESTLIENMGTACYKLEMLREAGFKVGLDDFGTGFSSLSYLQKLPIDILKVDKSFVDHIHREKKSLNIVRTIIDLSHSLDKKTVAEGVEQKEQAELLIELGCDVLQGYLFSKPIRSKYFANHLEGRL